MVVLVMLMAVAYSLMVVVILAVTLMWLACEMCPCCWRSYGV
jgi:hypothetical protein